MNPASCARPACPGKPAAWLAYDYEARCAWLDDQPPDVAEPSHRWPLCGRHADNLRVPRGWFCVDRRGSVPPPSPAGALTVDDGAAAQDAGAEEAAAEEAAAGEAAAGEAAAEEGASLFRQDQLPPSAPAAGPPAGPTGAAGRAKPGSARAGAGGRRGSAEGGAQAKGEGHANSGPRLSGGPEGGSTAIL